MLYKPRQHTISHYADYGKVLCSSCAECLSGAWLVSDGDKVICLRCGAEWLIIELLGSAVAFRLDKCHEFWEAHIDQPNNELER